MSACSAVGRRPDVELAKMAPRGAARLATASSSRLSPSRSGALSWTNSASRTASSGELANETLPSAGNGASVSRPHARRAFSSISCTASPAPGAGSYTRTSTPFSAKRAAQPPPITPPPSRATVRGRSAMAHESQLLAHVVGAEDARVHRLEDRPRALDEIGVRRQPPARQVEVVLEADAHVAAAQRRERDVGQLHPTDRERREHRAGRQARDEREQRRRVVRRAVADAHAELDERRVVDEPVADELVDHHEV